MTTYLHLFLLDFFANVLYAEDSFRKLLISIKIMPVYLKLRLKPQTNGKYAPTNVKKRIQFFEYL